MAEAFRTTTVTGQRLLQEPEAVSDDDDDDDTVLGETRSEESEHEESENEKSKSEEGDEFEPLTKRVIHQVSYSVSTFCRNEIKERNHKRFQQHIFISFPLSGKNWLPPPLPLPLCSTSFSLEIFHSLPQNHHSPLSR